MAKMKKYTKEIILNLLKDHPEGLTIQKISKLTGMSRITATKYVHELIGEEKILERRIGVARLMFPKERFLDLVKEEEIIKKLRKRL